MGYVINNQIMFIDPNGMEIIPIAGGYNFVDSAQW